MKKKKAARRVLIMLMAFLLLAGLVPITASAATPYSGQMVPGNYEITSAGQLDTLAKRVNDSGYNYPGSTFTLLNDIDMSGRPWTPIGTTPDGMTLYPFSGVFDGGGNTISNLTCNGGMFGGLFGLVSGISNYPAEIKNLELTNVNISGAAYCGGICAYSPTPFCTFSNCAVNGGAISGSSDVGGIAGQTKSASQVTGKSNFNNCYVNATVTSAGDYAGGICGRVLHSVSVSSCYVFGTVSGGNYAGGLTGNCGDEDSSANTVIKNSFALQSAITGGTGTAGRIAGDKGAGVISACYAWEGMTVGGGPVGSDPAGKNGASLTADAALTGSTYLNAGWSAGVWTLENGKLPYITAFGEVDPGQYAYLTGASGGDETAPVLSEGSCTSAGATYAVLRFASDEAGDYYCLALQAAEPQPDTDTIKAAGVSGAAQAAVNSNIFVYGLTGLTDYVAYLIVEDASGNTSDIASIPFATVDTDAAPPLISGVYQIGSAGQLCWFRDLVNGALTDGTPRNTAASAVLTADIDLSSVCGTDSISWIPIGNASGAYAGTFDGAGHRVSNLYINTSGDNQALFGKTGAGIFKDLTVQGSVYSAGNNIAGMAANASGGVFTGCRNEATVSAGGANIAGEPLGNQVGGVAGSCTGGVCFEACSNGGAISGYSRVGGIAGDAPSAIFEDGVNTGAVAAQNTYAGGIAGIGKSFNRCKNTGSIESSAFYAGGITGGSGLRAVTDIFMTSCENTASVTGYGVVGGISGLVKGGFSITGCANNGDVTVLYAGMVDSGRAGGLFGRAEVDMSGGESSVTGCYNAGNITDLSGPDALGGAGGLFGFVSCSDFSLTIRNCYSSGNISGINDVGGLLGSVTAASSGTVAVTNCYSAATAVTDTSGAGTTRGGAVGRTALSGGAVYLSNLFFMDCGIINGIGDDAANAGLCTAGAKSGDAMKTQSFVTQLGGAFALYADGIAEIAGEPPAGTDARFAAYEYPILRSWLELADNTTYNVQFHGAEYADVSIDGLAAYATTVAPGQSISFTVASKYTEVTFVSVSSGGTALTPDGDGNYTLSDITTDTAVTVVTSGQPDVGGGEEDVFDVTFTTTPAEADVTVTGGDGAIAPDGGVYKLTAGNYTYTVSADGYVTQTGSFNVSGHRNLAVTLMQEGTACAVTLDSSIAVRIVSDGLVIAAVPGGQVPTVLELGAGTYSYETDGWGGGSFTVKGDMTLSLRKVDFSAQLKNPNNVLYTMSITDDNGIAYVPGGTTLSDGDARARFLLPLQKGKIAYNYTFNVPDAFWACSGSEYIYSDTDFSPLHLSDDGAGFLITPKITLSITVPEGSTLTAAYRHKFYRPACPLSGTSVNNGNGAETYTFDAPASAYATYYELKLDGYVKKSDIMEASTADINLTIPLSDLQPISAWSGDVKDASQDFYEANLLMNVDDSKYIVLPEGGEFELYLFRAWQPVDDISANHTVDPDYHYEVIYGDSVEIADPYYAGATIKAVPGKTGLSAVKITYDALDHCDQVYSRLWTENTGIVIVNVGADSSGTTIDPGITLSDHDTVYYTRSLNGVTLDANKQYAEYTFTPTAESTEQPVPVTSVRVHEPLGDTDWAQNNWNNDVFWTDYSAGGDGSYTVRLTDGRNVIEIRAGDAVTYYTVNAYGADVTISGAQVTKSLSGRLYAQIETGAPTEITFEELRMPIAKLGAIINPGYPDTTFIVYTMDGGAENAIESEHTQYDIRLNNTITLPAFSEPGQHSLINGKIHTTAFVAGRFSYRDITKGSTSRTEYQSGGSGGLATENDLGYFSILPDIEFTVVEAKTDAEIVAELIDAIGTVTKDSANAINAARDAYDALSADEKSRVTNYNVLLAAEEAFERILEESGPTPVFTQNISGTTATYKIDEAASALQVAVSVAERGTLTYQWYVMSEGTGGFTPIAGAVTSFYRPSTQEEGVRYYKVIVTNNYEGNAYTAESGVASILVEPKASGKDITHTTSYYPTTGLSFNMNGKGIAGYVTLSVVDYGIRKSSKVDFVTPLGVLILPTQVPYATGDTIATVMLRLLDALNIDADHWGADTSGFYLASIENFYVSDGTLIDSFGEFDAGGGSGWMVTWNNWFINMGASEFQVDDGDIIKWQYTCQLGNDIGNSMDNPSAEITGINFASNYGTLSPAFNINTDNYTYTIPSTVKSIRLEATQANYWAQLIYTSGGKTYKPLQSIPVDNGTKITLECNYYNDYTHKYTSLVDSDQITITIKVSDDKDASITPSVLAVDGEAKVTIACAQLNDAVDKVEQTGGDIIIAPEITGTVNLVSVDLPKASVSTIASQTNANLVLSSPVGSMTIPNGALASIATQASGGTINMSLGTVQKTTLATAQREAVGDHTVYDISITSDGQAITSFGGSSVTLSLPYTLKAGEDPSDVKVWYLNDAGELTEVSCSYNASTGMVSFSTNHLSYYVVGYPETDRWNNPFTDVSADDWFYEAVEFAVTNGLFNGTSDTTFSPDVPMSRAMLVTVLYRLEGEPAVTGADSFTDVKSGQWYTNAVLWASGNSIVAGYGDGLFGVNDAVTREQMAAILYRYAKYKGYDVSAAANLSVYADADYINDWASRALKWANAEGLITGVTSAALDPSGSATRAQVATIFMRFVENVAE